jgi:hypothetical protein
MQLIQDRLQAGQDATVELDGEGALETRFMLRLGKESLQFN